MRLTWVGSLVSHTIFERPQKCSLSRSQQKIPPVLSSGAGKAQEAGALQTETLGLILASHPPAAPRVSGPRRKPRVFSGVSSRLQIQTLITLLFTDSFGAGTPCNGVQELTDLSRGSDLLTFSGSEGSVPFHK